MPTSGSIVVNANGSEPPCGKIQEISSTGASAATITATPGSAAIAADLVAGPAARRRAPGPGSPNARITPPST